MESHPARAHMPAQLLAVCGQWQRSLPQPRMLVCKSGQFRDPTGRVGWRGGAWRRDGKLEDALRTLAEVTGQALLQVTTRAVQDNGLESGFTSGHQVCDLLCVTLSKLLNLSGPPVPRLLKKRMMALSSRFLRRSRDSVLKCLACGSILEMVMAISLTLRDLGWAPGLSHSQFSYLD